MQTIITTDDDLSKIVAAALQPQLDELKMYLEHRIAANAPEYITTAQALDFLHLSKPTLHKLRAKGLIECVRSSDNRVLYRRSQIEAYLTNKSQKGGAERD